MRDFIGKIFGFYKEINALKAKVANLEQETKRCKEQTKISEDRIAQLQKEAAKLLGEIDMLAKQVPAEDPNEKFWNNKYPKQDITYNARAFFNSKKKTPVDVRIFFQPNDFHLRDIVNKSYIGIGNLSKGSFDEQALKCLIWVHNFFPYVDEKTVVNMPEFWMFVFEALFYGKGDCDDGAILLANLMLVAGIPYWRIRLNAGDVKGGGHCYVTYCREVDNEWVVLDWCYWYDDTPIENRVLHKDQRDYYDLWFSWNKKYAFGKMQTMAGMPKDFNNKKQQSKQRNIKEKAKKSRK